MLVFIRKVYALFNSLHGKITTVLSFLSCLFYFKVKWFFLLSAQKGIFFMITRDSAVKNSYDVSKSVSALNCTRVDGESLRRV